MKALFALILILALAQAHVDHVNGIEVISEDEALFHAASELLTNNKTIHAVLNSVTRTHPHDLPEEYHNKSFAHVSKHVVYVHIDNDTIADYKVSVKFTSDHGVSVFEPELVSVDYKTKKVVSTRPMVGEIVDTEVWPHVIVMKPSWSSVHTNVHESQIINNGTLVAEIYAHIKDNITAELILEAHKYPVLHPEISSGSLTVSDLVLEDTHSLHAVEIRVGMVYYSFRTAIKVSGKDIHYEVEVKYDPEDNSSKIFSVKVDEHEHSHSN